MAAKLGHVKAWEEKTVICYFLLFSVINMAISEGVITAIGTNAGGGSSMQKLGVQRQLNKLNKPAVKSIKSSDGDIIDCVLISNQPAFDHPGLKNHKIQRRPNFHPEGRRIVDENKVGSNSKPMSQLWQNSGNCPKGTIPIRRTKEDDVMRASSIEQFGKKKHQNIPQPSFAQSQSELVTQNGHQHAIVYVQGDKYYGAKATINVWKPDVQQPNEFSLSQIWLLSGTFGKDLNSIEAGWQVSPDLYGDNNTRFFIYWTSDSYQGTGCYNLFCSGFIQTNNEIALGATISPLSGYGGSQYDITILIWKDPKQGNWWMQYGNNQVLGYWPASLFPNLSDSATVIEWGGEVVNSESNGQHTTTQMGSGHFPEEGFGKASFFKGLQVVSEDNQLVPPSGIATYTDQSNCYNVKSGSSSSWGSYFYYGGPGRNPNCQ
ncbi:uncharacterized protein LOC129312663 [Prosopis cineraria]|uniref:uncharacterized protein LOC129312663 n=1 Tax=Prosopis cineraria TaxID=364024 RepID=UPI00240EFF2F|nr:uncharacterized protein LOC129312663 [Prosopis cineraria]